MHYFLDLDFDPEKGLLNPEESRHAIKALRLAEGEEIMIGNGRGTRYRCIISSASLKGLLLSVVSEQHIPPPDRQSCIALAPTKNSSRLEWWLEKATELGITQLMPLHTARTEHPRVNADRLARIALAAAKQSERDYLPIIAPLTPFAEALQSDYPHKFIAHCIGTRPRIGLSEALAQAQPPAHTLLLVGPEGDFTEAEVQAAAQAGFTEVHLGPQRLRTETAGVYCAALLSAYLYNHKP